MNSGKTEWLNTETVTLVSSAIAYFVETFAFKCSVCVDVGSLLESYLDGELYEARKCSKIARTLSDVVKTRVKQLLFLPRYKLVASVMIGQDGGQSISVASRSLWNAVTDTFSSASYRNGSLFAVATVFAVYFE